MAHPPVPPLGLPPMDPPPAPKVTPLIKPVIISPADGQMACNVISIGNRVFDFCCTIKNMYDCVQASKNSQNSPDGGDLSSVVCNDQDLLGIPAHFNTFFRGDEFIGGAFSTDDIYDEYVANYVMEIWGLNDLQVEVEAEAAALACQ